MANSLDTIMNTLRAGGPRGVTHTPDIIRSGSSSKKSSSTEVPGRSYSVFRPHRTVQHVPDIITPRNKQEQEREIWEPSQGQKSLNDIIGSLGSVSGPGVAPPPEPIIDENYIQQLAEEWGVTVRSPEEIQQHASAIVERQAMDRRQVVERELERFERDFPNEFEKAKTQIQNEAASMNAQSQEEFANRGMFYSSVMASAVGKVDEKATEMIGEISRDAANRVADLNADIRDIAEWAILEEEVVRRTLEQEDQELRKQLMDASLEVAFRAEQSAMDRWYKQQQLELQAYSQRIQAKQMQIQQAIQHNQNLAAAFMANDPEVQASLRSLGITQDKWNAMGLSEQSNLVQQVISYEGMKIDMESQRLQNEMIVRDMEMTDKYGPRDMSGEQAIAMVDNALPALLAEASAKKLKPEDIQSIRFRLDTVKSYANSIGDAVVKDRVNRQIQQIESKLSPKEKTSSSGGAFSSASSFSSLISPGTGQWESVAQKLGIIGKD